MKKLILLLICSVGYFIQTNAQNLLKDWNFENVNENFTFSVTSKVNVDQPGWFVNYATEMIKVLNDRTPAILTDSVKYDDTKFNKDTVLIKNLSYKGDIIKKLENGNHYAHLDPISIPASTGFDFMLWQEVFDLTPGAYELRFKVRSSITSFLSNVILPNSPGLTVNIKDVTSTFVALGGSVIQYKESETWRTHRVNFTVKNAAASTRISFWFDRMVSYDLDDVELIPLGDGIIPTYKSTATKTLQNEGLADFEAGNYPSTLTFAPVPGQTASDIFTQATLLTGSYYAFPAPNTVNSYGPNTVASRVNGFAVEPYIKDTVFWSPYIIHGADPMQGALSWRAEVRNLTTDSLNAYRASISTPCFEAQGANGVAKKVKLIFWAHTEGKDMLLRVDNISGSGVSTNARKVQNVLISGTEYKEYVVNDTMPAVMPNQSMNGVSTRPTPRYRLNLRTPHSVFHIDYMRLETWDGVTAGSPNAPDPAPTALINPKSDINYAKIAISGGNVIVEAKEAVKVSVYNLSGVLVKQQNLNGSRIVEMNGKAGVFIVKAIGKSGQTIQKVIL